MLTLHPCPAGLKRASVAAFLITLLPLVAQQPPATPTDGAAKFTSSTQLVVETVIVKDKSGNPIEGLTAKDFTITEDGKPQVISFCEYQALKDSPDAAPPALLANATPVETAKVDSV